MAAGTSRRPSSWSLRRVAPLTWHVPLRQERTDTWSSRSVRPQLTRNCAPACQSAKVCGWLTQQRHLALQLPCQLAPDVPPYCQMPRTSNSRDRSTIFFSARRGATWSTSAPNLPNLDVRSPLGWSVRDENVDRRDKCGVIGRRGNQCQRHRGAQDSGAVRIDRNARVRLGS